MIKQRSSKSIFLPSPIIDCSPHEHANEKHSKQLFNEESTLLHYLHFMILSAYQCIFFTSATMLFSE